MPSLKSIIPTDPKNIALTALIGIAGSPCPFLPRQLTLIGTFSIGVPGFFLALAPNEALVRPGFLTRVLRFSIPAGAVAGTTTFVLYEIVRRMDDVTLPEARTAATATLLFLGLVTLLLISRPWQPWKAGLAAAMAACYVLVMVWSTARDYFELDLPPGGAWIAVGIASIIGAAGLWLSTRVFTND